MITVRPSVATLFVGASILVGAARAEVSVAYDAQASEPERGRYVFTFSGAEDHHGAEIRLSGLEAIGQSRALFPRGSTEVDNWSFHGANFDFILFGGHTTGGNGAFVVTADPNLMGELNWSYKYLAVPFGIESGTVRIAQPPPQPPPLKIDTIGLTEERVVRVSWAVGGGYRYQLQGSENGQDWVDLPAGTYEVLEPGTVHPSS